MDYNDNDHEGQNLHLTGEESSKIYSVLRPFALPKFDFVDSLQGHLKFDSLVENEVFLGIPSQEDNQWIEDFSRGSSGIVFSSGAAESCALPRHINVWSEATSSESVEMLLKAVRQEEMVPGENLMEESEPGNQLGSSALQMENNVTQDAKVDDGIDYGNSSLPPVEVDENRCRSNQSAGVVVIQAEYNIHDAKIDEDIDHENSSLPPAEVEGDICRSNQSAGVGDIQAECNVHKAKIDDDIAHEGSSLPPAEVEGGICRSNQNAGVEVIQSEYDLQDSKIDDGTDCGNSSLQSVEVGVNTLRSNQNAGIEVIQAEYDLRDAKIDDGMDHGNSSLPPAEAEENSCRSNQSAGVEVIQAEYNLHDAKINEDMDCEDSSLPPAEVERNICRSTLSAGVEVVPAEYNLQDEAMVSIYGVCADDNNGRLTENSENPKTGLKITSDNQVTTCGLVNESLSTHDQENIHGLCTEIGIEKTENSSPNVAVAVKESLDQEKLSDIGSVSPSFVTESISPWVEDQEEGCKKRLGGSSRENEGTERHCFHEFPSEMESPKEEHTDEMCVVNLSEQSGVPGIAETVSTRDRCIEDAFVVAPSSDSRPVSVVFSSDTEIKQLSEGHSIFHENSSVSLQGEGIGRLEVEGGDAAISAIRANTEMKQTPVNQESYHDHTPVGSEDSHPGSHNSFDAPHVSFEVLATPDKVGGANHVDGPDSVAGSNFDRGSCGEKSVIIRGINDAGDTAAVQQENVEDGDCVALPLVIVPTQLDAREDGLNVTVHEKDVNKLPLDSSEMICDDEEKEMSNFSAYNNGVELTKLTSYVEGDGLVEGKEHESPSCDMAIMDQSEKTESQASEQPLTSVSKDSLELNEVTPVFESEKGVLPDSEIGKSQTSGQSVLLENSITVMPDEGRKKLCEKMDNLSNDLIIQDGGAEATHTARPMEAEVRKISGSNSSAMSDTSCAVEMYKSNQDAPPDIITDLPQRAINNQALLRRDGAEVLTASKISGLNVSSKEAETFTFDIRPLGDNSTGDSGKEPLSFPRIQAFKLSSTGELSPSTSGSSQTGPVEVKEVSHIFPSSTSPSGVPKGPSGRKVKRVNSKSGKASASKENQGKEMTPLRQTKKWENLSQFMSPLGSGQLVTFESVVTPRGPVSIPTSSLPDLNTSAPSSMFFQQPFTDLQQVQLRAQIFVYGSLIQGALPDNTCMISAFDGDRDFWEPSWRACVDRLHGEKSLGKNTETPVSLRPGIKAPDQAKKHGFSQSEAFACVAGQASNKAITSPVVNPMNSLLSPLWNTSTPSTSALSSSSMGRNTIIDYQAVAPMNPFQTPPVQNYVGHTTWSSKSSFPAPWFAPLQTSAHDISTNPAFLIPGEPRKLTRSKESSLTVTSSTKHESHIRAMHTETSAAFVGDSSLNLKKLEIATAQTADTNTGKRKKSSGAEDDAHVSMTTALDHTVSAPAVASQFPNKVHSVEGLNQISFISRSKGDQMPTPVVISQYSASAPVATPSRLVHNGTANQVFSMVSPSSTSDQFKRGDVSVDNRVLNIESYRTVEEAKLQAQEASAHAAAAVSQCEGVWSQLGQQNNSGLTSDARSKLSSAAVAIAAAAAVAKAAAAAAKIASTAALQAKQMAEEAVIESETLNATGRDTVLVSNSMNLVNASHVSILQDQGRNNAPSLTISAAREASKKRTEAASRHAENLNATVKAAELAAEAVSHAGKIVSMSEAFSLSELSEAGPNSYWKVLKVGDDKSTNKYINYSGEVPEVHMNQYKKPDKHMHVTSSGVFPILELSRNMVDDHAIEENIIASGKHGDNFKLQKDTAVSDSANTVGSDPDIESRSTSYTLSSIKEGSYVEVLKDRGDLKKAWFSAKVLELKNGEALVSYTELKSNEGCESLKEWVSTEAKDGEAPKVRIPHEMTAVHIEGTRKRPRAAVKDYTWSVGDNVDAWVQDCWSEGIISEKNQEEATTYSVHFPVQGETLPVKAWHLRPTLIWSIDQWIEWCGPRKDFTSQGDTPAEKRPKIAKNMNYAETGRNEVLPLAAKEKTFSVGTSTREENKLKMARTIGVPKPGKKRKFMEVSKHYVSDRVVKTKSKELQVVESRTKDIKSWKPPSIPSRTLAWKDDSTSSRSNTGKGSMSNDENESGQKNLAGSGSFSNVEESSMVFSSQALPPDSRKKTWNAKSGLFNRGKLASTSRNPAKHEANEKITSESSEPRRSIRRIKPTSRLLEGLQSSLPAPRIPSSSHEKSHSSTLNKGTIRGNNSNRG